VLYQTTLARGSHRSKRPKATCAAFFTVALVASCGTGTASPLATTPTNAATPTTGQQLNGSSSTVFWQQFLKSCKNLGPSKARSTSVILNMDDDANPAVVQRWATAHGLQLQWYIGHAVAVLAGGPASLGTSLDVRVDDYRSPSGQLFYSATTQPSVPTELFGQVQGVGRLSNYKDFHTDYVPGGGLTPQGMLQAYDATPLSAGGINGAGETVVALELDGFNAGDLNAFTSKFNLPAFNSSNFVTNGAVAKPEGETTMDLETIREIAPAAKIVYYNLLQDTSATNLAELLLAGFSRVIKLYPGAIWTMSIGGCEKASTFADLDAEAEAVAKAETQGSTVFASSGDTAGFECVPYTSWGSAPKQADVGVSNPAVLPDITGVGGTLLSVSTAGSYLGETTWFWPFLNEGTSGGQSSMFAQPTWQVGQNLPAPSNKVPRLVPDIAADADPNSGNADYDGGSWGTGGGTSLSSPIWAAFTALMDQYLRQHGKGPIGFLNPALYYLADHAQTYPPFHAVTTGGNEVWRNEAGYNESTGLGSPDVYNLVRDILPLEGAH
jgi:kumamolisin